MPRKYHLGTEGPHFFASFHFFLLSILISSHFAAVISYQPSSREELTREPNKIGRGPSKLTKLLADKNLL